MESHFAILLDGLWELFSMFNGNPDYNSYKGNFGVRLSLGMFFSAFFFMIIRMRAINTMEKRHIVTMVGAFLLFIRYTVMFVLEWGYQIGLYNDPIVHFLFPPLEHFFYMLAFGCFGYYSLLFYDSYNPKYRKIKWYIPAGIVGFFMYATVTWKEFFYEGVYNGIIYKYKDCYVDWQSHTILSILALWIVILAVCKYKPNAHYLSAFWTITAIEHIARACCFYFNWEPAWLATMFHGIQLWAIPLLILHFIKAYVVKLRYCEVCKRHVHILGGL